jgi:hypothetical protein
MAGSKIGVRMPRTRPISVDRWGRSSSTALRSYNLPKKTYLRFQGMVNHNPCRYPIMYSVSVIVLVLLLLGLVYPCNSIVSGEEPTSPIHQGQGLYRTSWPFGSSDFYNSTSVEISDSEVQLKSYNHQWNQTTKRDFITGDLDNVIITQEFITSTKWSDDFESGDGEWERGILEGIKNDWERDNISVIPDFIGAHDSGTYIWGTNPKGKYNDEGGTPSDYYLRSPDIDLTNSENTELVFWHYYDFEDDVHGNDGGRIEVSGDLGQTWIPVQHPGYDGRIEDLSNPLHDQYCFTFNSSVWIKERIDISDYDGVSHFSFRFRFATNGQTSDWGWYIDDVEVTSTVISDRLDIETYRIQVGSDIDWIGGEVGITAINMKNPVDSDGLLTEWTVKIADVTPSAQGKMKIFRQSGDQFEFVGETQFEDMEPGENTFDCSIEVKKGDLIGWYGYNASIFADPNGNAYTRSGDISDTTQNSSWNLTNRTYAIKAEGFFRYSEGTFISPVHDVGGQSIAIWENIAWESLLMDPSVDIELFTRSGSTETPGQNTWTPWSSPLTNPDNSPIKSPKDRFIQFKAILSTSNQAYTPILINVTLIYSMFSRNGDIETRDFVTADFGPSLPVRVVQWLSLTTLETLNGQTINYNYSLDSGGTWYPLPEGGDLSSISVDSGKIRFKADLSTTDTSASPILRELTLIYSSAEPKMHMFLETDQSEVRAGDTIYFRIYYNNSGIGNASDVRIKLRLNENLDYRGNDNGDVSTIDERENAIIWHFNSVPPTTSGYKLIIVETKVKDVSNDASFNMSAQLNYTDMGGSPYEGIVSSPVNIRITESQDLLLYYITAVMIGLAVFIILLYLISRSRRKDGEEDHGISIEDVERGIGYLIMEENPTQSYQLFSNLIDKGIQGLCITRTFPAKVKTSYYFEGVSLLWLSRSRDESSILPTNLGGLLREVKDFIEENEKSVVLFDGLEYLTVHNDFQKVLKLVHGLNELTAINNAMLIIPLNPSTLDHEKVALLKRDLRILG